ncbi:hypothetical protein ACFO3A_12800 [Comamonas nitrativorans]|uniref:Periplasmic protein n=1 Tax=Comamonas nitrativorans TaxID=108437 RepID=A0ABV9H134_9BURK
MKKKLSAFFVMASVAFFGLMANADARNYPCSGKKGGVSHCQNGKFVCKDGTISASKQICR